MNPGPAGIPQFEYIFSRIVCISVPLGFTALLVILIVAGIKYLMSAGEPKAISQAHQTVTWGLLGIVFLAISWLILQLIQNFTGIQVTKFTLSSLPGVQGFTGSCWEEAPIAPAVIPPPIASTKSTNNSPQTMVNSTTNSTNSYLNTSPTNPGSSSKLETVGFDCSDDLPGFNFKATLCLNITLCSDPRNFFNPLPVNMQLKTIAYRPPSLPELEKVITKPTYINIVAGSEKLWELKPGRIGFNGDITPFVSAETGTYNSSLPAEVDSLRRFGEGIDNPSEMASTIPEAIYAQYPKGFVPKDLIEALYQSHQILYEVSVKKEPHLRKEDFQAVSAGGYRCDDGDYISIRASSPIIYLYSDKIQEVDLKINSPIKSTTLIAKDGYWHTTVLPNKNIMVKGGKEQRYIDYDYLILSFARPDRGAVLNRVNLQSYLKNNLWKNLGLTNQEIEDYWDDLKARIPKSPYYFISLIDKSEINRVLPMEVNPKPDTIIRNMTYILPLSSPFIPTPLPNEQLRAPQRNGFTVLENGGFIDGF